MPRPKKLPLSGIEKTAILMNTLGEEKCFELMQHMKDNDLRKLLGIMGQVKKAPIILINDVLTEYLYEISEQENIIFDENLTHLETVREGLGEDRVKNIYGSTKEVEFVDRKNLPILDSLDDKDLAEFLVEEHPQTISLIVSHMDLNRQRSMIKLFPDAIRTEVLLRMANLEHVDEKLIDELEESLNHHFKTSGATSKATYGGIETIGDLIQSLDKKTMNSVLSRLESKDPLLTEEIRQNMFTFTDISKIDDKGLQAVIRSVPNEKLLLAMKTAPEELKDKINAVLSERASKILMEDLDAMGPQKVSDIEAAQRDVVAVVKRLEDEGKIVIGVGEENEIIP